MNSNIPCNQSTPFSMPTGATELFIGVVIPENNDILYCLSKVFVKGYDFTDSENDVLHMLGGYNTQNYNQGCYIGISGKRIYIDSVHHNGRDVRNASTYFVAYR